MIARWGRRGPSPLPRLGAWLRAFLHRSPTPSPPRPFSPESAMLDTCPSFVLLAPGRRVRCIVPDPAHDPSAHLGQVRVTLPDGRERVATLLWSDAGREHDDTAHAD